MRELCKVLMVWQILIYAYFSLERLWYSLCLRLADMNSVGRDLNYVALKSPFCGLGFYRMSGIWFQSLLMTLWRLVTYYVLLLESVTLYY